MTRSRPDAFIGAKLGAGSAGDDDDEEQFMTGAIVCGAMLCLCFMRIVIDLYIRVIVYGIRHHVHSATTTTTAKKIDERCSKCGHDKMRFFTMQLRSADEGQTVFYTCVKCQYTYSLNS